jgi:hypothetical protein
MQRQRHRYITKRKGLALDPWHVVPAKDDVARSMNIFHFIRINKIHEHRIDLTLQLPGGREKEAYLPKNEIILFSHDHEVEIPEWLCIKEGLI